MVHRHIFLHKFSRKFPFVDLDFSLKVRHNSTFRHAFENRINREVLSKDDFHETIEKSVIRRCVEQGEETI